MPQQKTTYHRDPVTDAMIAKHTSTGGGNTNPTGKRGRRVVRVIRRKDQSTTLNPYQNVMLKYQNVMLKYQNVMLNKPETVTKSGLTDSMSDPGRVSISSGTDMTSTISPISSTTSPISTCPCPELKVIYIEKYDASTTMNPSAKYISYTRRLHQAPIFQIERRVTISVLQKITTYEFLPTLLNMAEKEMKSLKYIRYDSSIDPRDSHADMIKSIND